jgi:S1-C subfamily serine protease
VGGAKGVDVTIGNAKPVHGDVVHVDEESDVAVVRIAGTGLAWLEMYQGDVEVGMHLRAVRGASMVDARFEEWENLGHDLGLAGNLSPWDCGTPLLADDGTVVGVVRGAVSTSGDRPVATPVWRLIKLMPQLPAAQKQAIEHPGER